MPPKVGSEVLYVNSDYFRKLCDVPVGWHVHHVDGNRLKNYSEKNLVALPAEEHIKIHNGLKRCESVLRKERAWKEFNQLIESLDWARIDFHDVLEIKLRFPEFKKIFLERLKRERVGLRRK